MLSAARRIARFPVAAWLLLTLATITVLTVPPWPCSPGPRGRPHSVPYARGSRSNAGPERCARSSRALSWSGAHRRRLVCGRGRRLPDLRADRSRHRARPWNSPARLGPHTAGPPGDDGCSRRHWAGDGRNRGAAAGAGRQRARAPLSVGGGAHLLLALSGWTFAPFVLTDDQKMAHRARSSAQNWAMGGAVLVLVPNFFGADAVRAVIVAGGLLLLQFLPNHHGAGGPSPESRRPSPRHRSGSTSPTSAFCPWRRSASPRSRGSGEHRRRHLRPARARCRPAGVARTRATRAPEPATQQANLTGRPATRLLIGDT